MTVAYALSIPVIHIVKDQDLRNIVRKSQRIYHTLLFFDHTMIAHPKKSSSDEHLVFSMTNTGQCATAYPFYLTLDVVWKEIITIVLQGASK